MDLNRALEIVIEGNAILFAGAGFSVGAKNLRGMTLKTSKELASHFQNKLGLKEPLLLEDASEEFANQFNCDSLIEELQNEFTVKQVTKAQTEIVSLPWKRIYTTNYDNVLERAASDCGKKLMPVLLSNDIRDLPKRETHCVHINGYVDMLDRKNFNTDLKLTESSHLTQIFSDSHWASVFRQDIQMAQSVFFIGYSLYDIDIKRILFTTNSLTQKTFFIIGSSPDGSTLRRAKNFGQVLQITSDDLSHMINKTKSSYAPPNVKSPIFWCLEKYDLPEDTSKLTDQHVFDLLLYGNFNRSFIAQSLSRAITSKYYLRRKEIDAVLNLINKGHRALVIHSELGNGKSLLIEGLKLESAQDGFNVFCLKNRSDDLFKELDIIFKLSEKVLLVVEQYHNWDDVIQYFGTHAPTNVSLVLSERTVINDVVIDNISRHLKIESIPEIDVNHLNVSDIEWIANYLNEYGLWGKDASSSLTAKKHYLSYTCRSQFHSILLKVLESPQIINKFETLVEELNNNRDYYNVLITILILTVIDFRCNINMLVDVCGNKILDSQFKKDNTIRQMLNVNYDSIIMKSSVAAQYVLKHIENINKIIDVLISISLSLDKISHCSRTHELLFGSLMRFSNLQIILPEKGLRRAIIKYYEAIKNCYNCKFNYHFWLQYAIACLTLDELERAEKYFETSYALAKKRKFDTFQIDNHYARFLLVKAIKFKDSSTCMKHFRKARTILNNQIKKERLHYAYRVAKLYSEFYETFKSNISIDEINEINRAAKFIAGRIDKLPERNRQQRHIIECYESMVNILEDSD